MSSSSGSSSGPWSVEDKEKDAAPKMAAGSDSDGEIVVVSNIKNAMESRIVKKQIRSVAGPEVRQLVIYFVFLITFSLVILNSRDSTYSYRLNEYMKDLFLFEEFREDQVPNLYKTFQDVASVGEFWQYMSVFGDGLVNTMDNADDQDKIGYIYGQNVIVGNVRLRQIRIRPNESCAIENDFLGVFTTCYAQYDADIVSEEPFGGYFVEDNTTAGIAAHHIPPWEYQSDEELKSVAVIARLKTYEGGGFVHDIKNLLNSTEEEVQEEILSLELNGFIDLQTRAVVIDFTTYNTNLNLFHIAQIIFEFMPSGGVFPQYTFRVVRLYKYPGDGLGRVQAIGEGLLSVFVVFYLGVEIYEIYKYGCRRYFQDGWNIVDLSNLFLFLVAFFVRFALFLKFASLDFDPANADQFYDFQPVSLLNSIEYNVYAVNALLLWFKVFKYLRVFPGMDVITLTIVRSVRNVISFAVMLTFVFFGFSMAGYTAFGTDVEGFHTFLQTFFTLIRMLLGEFNFTDMQVSNRVFGPLFFFTFIVLVFFVLLSMFLAILNDSYTEVQNEIHNRSAYQVDLRGVVTDWFNEKSRWLRGQEEDVEKIRLGFMEGDVDNDVLLDREEIEEIFARFEDQIKTQLHVDTPDELLRMFDVNDDNLLDAKEQAALLAKLEKRKVQFQNQRQQAKLRKSLANNDFAILDEADQSQSMRWLLVNINTNMFELQQSLTHVNMVVNKLAIKNGLDPATGEALRKRRGSSSSNNSGSS